MAVKNIESFDEWLETYYKSIGPEAERDPELQALIKADDRFDYGSTDYYNPVYSATLALEGLTRSTTLYKLLPKTTYLEKGDSLHYISADATYMASFLGEEGTMFVSDTAIPTILDFNHIWPAVYHLGWESTRVGTEMSKFQAPPVTDINYLKQFFNTWYATALDKQLAGVYISTTVHGVDTPATLYGQATIECIDRMVSCYTECASTYVSAATDGDIYWTEAGSGSAKIARTGTTFDAQVKLPGSAAEAAYNILDELDDLMAQALTYAPTGERNYIGLCSPMALNKIQDELDPKQRFLEYPMDVYQTINGVSTRPGRMAGKMSVGGLTICGVKVPFFTSPFLGGVVKGAWVWENSQLTTGGVGNIYLINMDCMEIRHLIPITYSEHPNYAESTLVNRHNIFSAMQLIATNFAAHCALKYIKS